VKLPAVLCAFALGLVACSDAPDYEFRSDDRPAYDKSVTVAELAAKPGDSVVVLDVRLREDFEADPVLIPGAMYRNPENIEAWSSSLPEDSTVVVYCVKGKWVSQKAANYLAAKGLDVYSLDGGIQAWQSSNAAK
jgi:rhodanese-related sulfurtransferase